MTAKPFLYAGTLQALALACLLGAGSLSAVPAAAQAEPPAQLRNQSPARLGEDLRRLARQAQSAWPTPGFGLAVIYQGQPLLIEGYGWRDAERQLPVTPETLFAIGSATKAFTATALAMQVEAGKLDWDAPVRASLPEFSLADEALSAAVTTRDLLTHRTGLPRHDMVWYGSADSREALFAHLRALQVTAPLRARFQYQNLMYLSAGMLLERLSGQRWEEVMQTRILTPLGMLQSRSTFAGLSAAPDHALPYRLNAGKPQRVAPLNVELIAPAAGLSASSADMARWLRFNLGDGHAPDAPGAAPLLLPESLRELQSPQIVAAATGPAETPYLLYGLGWYLGPYRGHSLIRHGGNLDGYSAIVALLPESGSGIAILGNLGEDAMPQALLYALCDRLLGLPPIDWHKRLQPSAQSVAPDAGLPRVPGTQPSHDLRAYAGRYAHPAYGELRLSAGAGQLISDYRGLEAPLSHWHYDSFMLKTGPGPARMLSFSTDALGQVEALSIELEPAAAPIRFERLPDPALSQLESLKSFAGTYLLAGRPLHLLLSEGSLRIQIPGQPQLVLEPYRPDLFRLRGQHNRYLRFERHQGRVIALDFIGPEGVERALRTAE